MQMVVPEYPTLIRPEMIELRRRMLGLSQTEIAKRLEIGQGTLSKMEQGLKGISTEMLPSLSESLSCHPSFFSLPERLYGGPISAAPMYRKKASVGIKVIDRLMAQLNVRIGHIRKLLLQADIRPELVCPVYELEDYNDDPTEIARLVRRAWMMPTGPVRNLVELLERAGYLIIECDMNDSGLSGVSYRIHDLPPMIFINKSQPMDRYRFTLAHELGHLVMHRLPTHTMEEEANSFASEFLMPSIDIGPHLTQLTLEKAAYMKPFWRTSIAAIVYRAKTLNRITQGQYEYIWRQISAKGWRVNEPVQLEVGNEVPSLLKALFAFMQDQMGYTEQELVQVLGLYYDELREMYPFANKPRMRLVK